MKKTAGGLSDHSWKPELLDKSHGQHWLCSPFSCWTLLGSAHKVHWCQVRNNCYWVSQPFFTLFFVVYHSLQIHHLAQILRWLLYYIWWIICLCNKLYMHILFIILAFSLSLPRLTLSVSIVFEVLMASDGNRWSKILFPFL